MAVKSIAVYSLSEATERSSIRISANRKKQKTKNPTKPEVSLFFSKTTGGGRFYSPKDVPGHVGFMCNSH
jgi:hypothetical protein